MIPSGSMQYTLVGFSAELDWRPLHFIKPLPSNRVCSACGVVRPMTALLACGHTMCGPCYEQCAEGGSHVCPLDGYECQDEDVDWRDLSAGELLRRQVKCWNEVRGCQHVAPASGIVEHFRRDCTNHAACCIKCYTPIPCCDIVGHLKLCCGNAETSFASYGEGPSGNRNSTTFLTLCRAVFQQQVAALKVVLGRVFGNVSAHGDRLNEISHTIHSSKQSGRQELAAVAEQNCDGSALLMAEVRPSNEEVQDLFTAGIDAPFTLGSMSKLEKTVKNRLSQIETAVQAAKAEANENSQKALDITKSILRHVELGVAHCEFFVKNVASLHETAMKKGFAEFVSELVYIRGYCISPGFHFEYDGEFVNLHATMRIYKGRMDNFLLWPFEHKIKVTVIHPVQGEERAIEDKPFRSVPFFQRPTTSRNKNCIFDTSLDVEDLIRDGYVSRDQLRVKWYLFP